MTFGTALVRAVPNFGRCQERVPTDGIKNFTNVIRGKEGKFRPRAGHKGTDGEYRYSSTLSLTSGLDGGAWIT